MRRFCGFLSLSLIFSALLALAACGRSVPPLLPLGPNDVVLAFGDSLTHGSGADSASQSYPAVLAQRIGREVINAGVPGETSAEGLARLPALLEEHRPALVLLCHGGNDFLQKLDERQMADNLAAMIKLARGHGAQVVLIGVPKPSLLVGTAPVYQEIADKFQVPLEGEVLAEVLGKRGLKSDTVHPNAAGYRLVAEALAELLRRAGAL